MTNLLRFSRRRILQSTVAVALASAAHPVHAGSVGSNLTAAPGRTRLHVGQRNFDLPIWGYDRASPGRTLSIEQGGSIDLSLLNQLPEETSIHWHGIRTPNEMDGVPHVTQRPVAPGKKFRYQFRCDDAGTFWYHPHANSAEQIGRGLYGPLIVSEQRPVEVDRDLVWMVADWRVGEDGTVSDDFMQMHDNSHAGRFGNLITVNGQHHLRTDVRPGQRLRLRLVNAAAARILSFNFPHLAGWWIALDGQPITPRPFDDRPVYISPGGRADVILDIPLSAKQGQEFEVFDATYRNQRIQLASFKIKGKQVRAKTLATPGKIADNPLPRPDLNGAELKTVVFEGGAMGGLRAAALDGKQMAIRDLARQGVVWATNGKIWSSLAEIARQDNLFNLDHGKSYVFRLQNRTAFPHPIHLHGHTFQVIAAGGKIPATPTWRDTVLVFPKQDVDIAFVADNPGDWLLHCHILGHVTAGMIAAVRVG